jgi:hypothetical protein
MGQRHAGCGAEACRDLGRAGMRGGGVPELGAWAHSAGPMGWRCAGPMGRRRARTRVGGPKEACRADGRRRAGMWVGGMPGLWAGREEGRRRAGTSGVPGCWPIVPGRWGGGVAGRWGRGVPGLGAKASRTNGAEVCQDEVCRDVGRRCAGGMRGGGMPCHTGTSDVLGSRAETCRPDGVGGVVVGGWILTCLHDGPVVGVRLSRSSVGLAVGLRS